MNRNIKTLLIALAIALAIVIASSTTQQARACAVKTPPSPVICIRSGNTGPWLSINYKTGAFTFSNDAGLTVTGTGTLYLNQCAASLKADAGNIEAYFDNPGTDNGLPSGAQCDIGARGMFSALEQRVLYAAQTSDYRAGGCE